MDIKAKSTNEEKILSLSVKEYKKGYIKIEVSDNGIGIKPEHLTRIFEHGFTTKAKGHGFGLHSGSTVHISAYGVKML